MQIHLYLEEGDRDTPIEIADAIIKMYAESADRCNNSLDKFNKLDNLAQIAEHIQVYLNHNMLYKTGVDTDAGLSFIKNQKGE